MNKQELIEKFLEHVRTLTDDEKLAFIKELKTNKQTTGCLFEHDCCCVLGAFAKSKGIKDRDDLLVKCKIGVTAIVAQYFNIPCFESNWSTWPAMTHLNDDYKVTFPEFIKLIRSTMKANRQRRRYFICNYNGGYWGFENALDYTQSYVWHPGTGTTYYCHNIDGTDTVMDTSTQIVPVTIELACDQWKEVTQKEAVAFHKRCLRRAKKW